jgi:hypothetical protein
MHFRITLLVVSVFLFTGCASFFSAINFIPSAKITAIDFSNEEITHQHQFFYSDTTGNEYLRTLRQNYGLGELISDQPNEIEKIKAILHWTSQQWEHNGSNTPSKSDALTILEEAKDGKQFRCVEYGILATAGLNAVGIPSRVLGLKSRDVEKVKVGAGHVVSEVYSKENSKWIFIDPQMDIMPTLNGTPLNAVEFQHAIINDRQNIVLVNSEGEIDEDRSKSYLNWIGKYLYFFDVAYDQRIDYKVERKKVDGNNKIMLVPKGVENPTVFQRKYKINYCNYTNSLQDFYMKPKV